MGVTRARVRPFFDREKGRIRGVKIDIRKEQK